MSSGIRQHRIDFGIYHVQTLSIFPFSDVLCFIRWLVRRQNLRHAPAFPFPRFPPPQPYKCRRQARFRTYHRMFWSRGEECLRDSARSDFVGYRQWYGLLPPKHEQSILLGDLGRFAPTGDFLKLGSMFQPSEKRVLEKGNTAEKWLSVEKPVQDNIVMSEELVFDPFVSKTTGWAPVPEEDIPQYTHRYLN